MLFNIFLKFVLLDVEGFLNSLLSLIFALTEKRDEVICAFVKCLVDMETHIALSVSCSNVRYYSVI